MGRDLPHIFVINPIYGGPVFLTSPHASQPLSQIPYSPITTTYMLTSPRHWRDHLLDLLFSSLPHKSSSLLRVTSRIRPSNFCAHTELYSFHFCTWTSVLELVSCGSVYFPQRRTKGTNYLCIPNFYASAYPFPFHNIARAKSLPDRKKASIIRETHLSVMLWAQTLTLLEKTVIFIQQNHWDLSATLHNHCQIIPSYSARSSSQASSSPSGTALNLPLVAPV